MNWETLYCPNRSCCCYGLPFTKGQLVRNGSSHGTKQALCQACGRRIALSYGTAYYGLESSPMIFETAVRALAEGNSIQSTARIVQVDKDTVCAWLERAAEQCRLLMLYLWHDLPVSECQLDELWSFVHTKEDNLACAKLCCESYGDAWVWIAFAPQWRLVLAFVVGARTQAEANLLLERVKQVSNQQIPFFTSDQLPAYASALLHVYGSWHQPERQGSRGRYPEPRRVPLPDLLYHFCLPHLSLRQALPLPQPTRGNGSLKKWQQVTPAMAAGLTDHLWSTSELLAFRLPATFKDSLATPVSQPANQAESIT
jgi:transposase-like protein/IS1 family transposase